MAINNLIIKITDELARAKQIHPDYPDDPIHRVSIVGEESGEATRAALRLVYEGGSIEDLETELIQTASSCLRMLEAMEVDRNNINLELF